MKLTTFDRTDCCQFVVVVVISDAAAAAVVVYASAKIGMFMLPVVSH